MIVSKDDFKNLIAAYVKAFGNKGYNYAAIDYDGNVCVFKEKPYSSEEEKEWKTTTYYSASDVNSYSYSIIAGILFEQDCGIENWRELCVKI